jgi:tetratricopeptide (TPR) repeat protein
MEFIDGETLSAWIRRREPATTARKLKLIEELCDGLAYAHTFGIVHRDVKPANLMVERRRGRLKILDFGIAKLADSGITNAGALIGSFNYMSPEQVRGLPIDHRSDIFSVGAVLFELLSYRQAFPGGLGDGVLGRIAEQPAPMLRQAMEEADGEIEQIIARALQKEPTRRYQDLTEMHRDLTRARRRMERDDSDEHTVVDKPERRRPEPTPVPQTPRPTPPRGRAEEEAARVARLRAQQLEEYLSAAERSLSAGDYEAAIEQSYQASALDEDDPRARDVRDRAQAALDLQQVRQFLREARAALSRHDVDAAEDLVNRARELRPDVTEIRDVEQSVVRVRNHAAAIGALERARRSLEQHEWTNAIRESADADRFEPGLDEAKAIRRQAQAALDEQRRLEAIEQAARQAIAEARQAFARQQYQAAIDRLAGFAPAHAGVTRELQRLQAELSVIEERAARARAALDSARQALNAGAWDEARAAAEAAADAGADQGTVGRLLQQVEAGRARAEALARQQAQVERLLADAQLRFDGGDFRGAVARCDQALQIIANDEAVLALRERAQHAMEDEAERLRREAHDQAAAQILDQAGREFAAGRHQDAIARLGAFQPPHPRVTAAIEELRSAHAAIEARAADAIARARQTFQEGQHDAALNELARFEPAGLPSVTSALAALRTERRRLEDAAAEARRLEEERLAEEEARRVRAERVAVLLADARRHVEARRFDEALTAVGEASGLEPGNAEVAQLGKSVRAAKAEHEAAERKARDLATKVADAEARLAAGDFARALKRLDEVLAVEREHPAALALRARVLERQEAKRQEDEAAQLAAEEQRKARERAAQVAALLKKARKAKKPEQAIELLQQALAIEPAHAEARALLDERVAQRQRAEAQRPSDVPDQFRAPAGGDAGEPIPAPQPRPPVPAGVLAAAALVVVGLGGGLTWYFTRPDPPVVPPVDDPIVIVNDDKTKDKLPEGKDDVPTPPKPPLGQAVVTIDALPWADVTITPTAEAEGRSPAKCTTPCSLQLAEGSYELAYVNRGLSLSYNETITVVAGQPKAVRRTLPGFTADRAATAILGPSQP